MQVRKSSWHYKLVKAFRNDSTPPDDLCSYVRNVVGWSVVVVLLSPLLLLFYPMLWLDKAGDWVIDKIVDVIPHRAPKAEPESESLWRAWLRAKKEKICPLIEFKD